MPPLAAGACSALIAQAPLVYCRVVQKLISDLSGDVRHLMYFQ
jgi:hypothetical protein